MGHRNKKILRYVLALAACLVLVGYALVVAKTTMWKWVDEKGRAHYTDKYERVPEKYRSTAVRVEIEGVKQYPVPKTPPTKKRPPSASQQQETRLKAEWRKKARKAVQEVLRLEKAIEETEAECQALHQKWVTMPVPANQQALAQCHKKLERLKADLERARQYRDRGIYSEARKVGVPINWFDKILKGYEQ